MGSVSADKGDKKVAKGLAKEEMEDMSLADVGRKVLMQEAMARSIRKRAREIAMPGRYVGWFEWLMWAHIHAYRPVVLLASNEIELWDVFGAGLPKPALMKEVFVAGVFTRGLATMAATHFPLRMNHWMIGDKSRKAKIGARPWAKSAHVQADKAGWRLLETAAQGDCGIDAMAFWENRTRTEATWCEIRQELAAAMMSVSNDAAWQDAFVTCQESLHGGAAALAASAPKVSEPLGGPACGSGAISMPTAPAAATPKPSTAAEPGQSPSPPQPPPPPAAPPQPPATPLPPLIKVEPTGVGMTLSAIPSAASGSTGSHIKVEPEHEAMSLGKPLFPPATVDEARMDNTVEVHVRARAGTSLCALEAQTTTSQALALSQAGKAPPKCLNGQKVEMAFLSWIQQQSEEKQKAILQNYDSMKTHEEQWLANRALQEESALVCRPVKKRKATSLHERLEMGNAYRAWRLGAGATSRSPHKESGELLGKGPF